ncbi:alpha/beta fold hydrolase [Rhizobium glycinendophyticum]|uniref:Alpha/beta fold hydrolase n=2 Tax=Rhizobium glycinendophyticum TaxID=2589807 RepID=A0A504UJ15_9HYPH|nr:alpha/beta fold hydrolase [Rhizobium glycinendophyticum]
MPVLSLRSIRLAAPERGDDLRVRVSAPIQGAALPVIVFSHGFGSSMDAYGPLVDYWAAEGFVVVQPTHLDSRRLALAQDDLRRRDFWRHRVADLTNVIDHLATICASVPGLAGRVDLECIAVAGHSFGAWAASMLLGARTKLDGVDRSDKRVSAGLLLAAGGLGGDSLTEMAIAQTPYLDTDFAGLDRPTLVVSGDDDYSPLTTRGPDWFRDPYLYSPGASALLTLYGSKHMLGGISGYGAAETDFEEPRHVALVQQSTTIFLRSILKPDPLGWQNFCESLNLEKGSLGEVESKNVNR